jgi:hypothetical protein
MDNGSQNRGHPARLLRAQLQLNLAGCSCVSRLRTYLIKIERLLSAHKRLISPLTSGSMYLDNLEADFFGDLEVDTHGLWEVFGFVRLYYGQLSEGERFESGLRYLERWNRNGWLRIAETPIEPSSIRTMEEALAFARSNGVSSMSYLANSPSFDSVGSGLTVAAVISGLAGATTLVAAASRRKDA